jgi:fermentation-respiration switch protein FrsA (DUF1100 family)
VGCLALAAAGLARADAPDEARSAKIKATAQVFFDAVVKEDYAAAVKDFDDTMMKVMPAAKVEEFWKTLRKQVGPLQSRGGMRTEKRGKYDAVILPCRFEKLALDANVVFDAEGRITGLNFRPAATAEYKAPAYVQADAFREVDVKVGTGTWQLPGTLTLPKGDGPFPAVVLVHGSGPNDRDETILGNRPFRDLAWGLASRQVAVLRYDKRTHAHPTEMLKLKETMTVKDEVLDDALAAVALLRGTKEINPKRVYVLGHSLGALLAPRLGELDPGIAGLVVMAGPTRPLEELVLEQVTYITSLDGGPTDEQKAELEKLKEQLARVKDPKLSADTPAKELLLGVPASYWLSLRDYRPAEVAVRIKQPLLILQGERDYQVTMADFRGWQKALAGRPNATLKSYPKLNHLFAEGEGKSKPDEYMKAGHVAAEVIDDIVGWIKK